MCTSRNASASSETLRCSESTTNRGQRGLLKRLTPATPSARLNVSSSSATAPVERVRYQYVLGRPRRADGHRDSPSSARPVADEAHGAVIAHQARGQSQLLEPRRGCLRADQRGGAGDVRVQARLRGDAHRAPARRHGRAGRGIDDVVPRPSLVAPAPGRRAGGRDPAAADRDRLPLLAGHAAVVVGDIDPPALLAARRRRWRCRRRGRSGCRPRSPRAPRRRRDRRPTLSRWRRGRDARRWGRGSPSARGRARSPAIRA